MQVDLLKAGVDLFLTHGGQNSFMESLSTGVPVVVCPGFGDQPVNAQKAVDLGVGLKVDRPFPEEGEVETAAAKYRADVTAALLQVIADESFGASARRCAEGMRNAGGVPRAAEAILEAAKIGATACGRGEYWDRFAKAEALEEVAEGGAGKATIAGA